MYGKKDCRINRCMYKFFRRLVVTTGYRSLSYGDSLSITSSGEMRNLLKYGLPPGLAGTHYRQALGQCLLTASPPPLASNNTSACIMSFVATIIIVCLFSPYDFESQWNMK
jgi:hypothetical protein